jgi:rhodanese-related sulfurtransferase
MSTEKSSVFWLEAIFFRFLAVLSRSFQLFRPPFFNEDSTLKHLLRHYPDAQHWFLHRYRIQADELARNAHLSLREASTKLQLPPAQILFMEIQMSSKWIGIEFLQPMEAKRRLDSKAAIILDARDPWERDIANLSASELLTEEKLQDLARAADRSIPVLLYCHFGVRSTDFAVKLKEWGYQHVWVLQGGIDAWAQSVDPQMKRYEGSWC